MTRAVVVGGGSWGTGFSRLLADRGYDVTLATHREDDARAIRETGRNPRFLTQVDLSGIDATTVAEAPIVGADLVVLAVPSAAFRSVAAALPGDAPVLSLTKGLDPETGERLSTLVTGRPIAVLSGPNMSEEIVGGKPAVTVIASEDAAFAHELQAALNSGLFRIYVNTDLIGVELCAAAKNVIAIAAGGVDGVGLGDNLKAALVTRGLVEMARLGEALGAEPDTFAGLAGMGDLMVTCWHPNGRNRRAGELIARGATAEEARAEIGQVVEGLTTAPVLQGLARRHGVEMPITEGVCAVISGHTPLNALVEGLMGRRPTNE